jgi:ubiquinone/menaquinone biosynthesis C-methylase UbiE
MTQNIYDNAEFFEGYSRLPRSVQGLDGAPEWPALRALLPDLRGAKVLDLGCGFGWFCRWAATHGAAQVTGMDVSEKMLARARAEGGAPVITYVKADLEGLSLPEASFDLVYSSLALHYVEKLDALMGEVHRSLKPGGALAVSVEHPMMTAPAHAVWSADPDGRKTWPVSCYLEEGPRQTDWLTKGVMKQHRTMATYLNMLPRLGFDITRVEEWGPSPEQVAAHPDFAPERERPPFLLLAARKRA